MSSIILPLLKYCIALEGTLRYLGRSTYYGPGNIYKLSNMSSYHSKLYIYRNWGLLRLSDWPEVIMIGHGDTEIDSSKKFPVDPQGWNGSGKIWFIRLSFFYPWSCSFAPPHIWYKNKLAASVEAITTRLGVLSSSLCARTTTSPSLLTTYTQPPPRNSKGERRCSLSPIFSNFRHLEKI